MQGNYTFTISRNAFHKHWRKVISLAFFKFYWCSKSGRWWFNNVVPCQFSLPDFHANFTDVKYNTNFKTNVKQSVESALSFFNVRNLLWKIKEKKISQACIVLLRMRPHLYNHVCRDKDNLKSFYYLLIHIDSCDYSDRTYFALKFIKNYSSQLKLSSSYFLLFIFI